MLLSEADATSTPLTRYALAARLVVIGNLSDCIMHFNCRSGKDRTGFLDVEVKFLAYQISRWLKKEECAPLGESILDAEKDAWKEILLNSGNREIQELNSGYKGSLLDHEIIKARVGEENWIAFVGDSIQSLGKT